MRRFTVLDIGSMVLSLMFIVITSVTVYAVSNPNVPEDGIARNPDGSKRWILLVSPSFERSDLADVDPNAVLEWQWPEAGVAVASSFSETFYEDADDGMANPNIESVIPDLILDDSLQEAARGYDFAQSAGDAQAGADAVFYQDGLQWYLQAIGAYRPDENDNPVWQLYEDIYGNIVDERSPNIAHAYEGSGVTIGISDSGAPSRWIKTEPWWERVDPIKPLHPDFRHFDPAHPEEGGVVAMKPVQIGTDPETGLPIYHEVPVPPPDNLETGEYSDPSVHMIYSPYYGFMYTVYDMGSHGTGCASTIAAGAGTELNRFKALAPKAKLICYNHTIALADGIEYPVLSRMLSIFRQSPDDGVQILSCSWGFRLRPTAVNVSEQKLVSLYRRCATELNRRGVLFLAPAHNFGINMDTDWRTHPYGMGAPTVLLLSDLPNVLTIGGTAPEDYFPPFAGGPPLSVYNPYVPTGPNDPNRKGIQYNLDRICNHYDEYYGINTPVFGSCYGHEISVVAPMGSYPWTENPEPWWNLIMGSYPDGNWDYYAGWEGNSFATPMTAAVGALAAEAYKRKWGEFPSPKKLAQILKMSADDMVGPATDDLYVWNNRTEQFDLKIDEPSDQPGRDIRYGHGRVNVKRAIEYAMSHR